ncbi:hypothetical protein R6Z07F_001947 [Ovis aries]
MPPHTITNPHHRPSHQNIQTSNSHTTQPSRNTTLMQKQSHTQPSSHAPHLSHTTLIPRGPIVSVDLTGAVSHPHTTSQPQGITPGPQHFHPPPSKLHTFENRMPPASVLGARAAPGLLKTRALPFLWTSEVEKTHPRESSCPVKGFASSLTLPSSVLFLLHYVHFASEGRNRLEKHILNIPMRFSCCPWDVDDTERTWREFLRKDSVSRGASLVAQRLKCLPAMRETRVQSLGGEDPLEKEMAIHSSTLAWRIPWREEPGRLLSMGLQRVGHD